MFPALIIVAGILAGASIIAAAIFPVIGVPMFMFSIALLVAIIGLRILWAGLKWMGR